jgi:hypothetical protein
MIRDRWGGAVWEDEDATDVLLDRLLHHNARLNLCMDKEGKFGSAYTLKTEVCGARPPE